MAERSVKIAI